MGRRSVLNLEPHPLRAEIRKLGLIQGELSVLLGISETKLSRYLNRREQMPEWVERLLWSFVRSHGRDEETDIEVEY